MSLKYSVMLKNNFIKLPPNVTSLSSHAEKSSTETLQTDYIIPPEKIKMTKKRWYEFETPIIWSNVFFIIGLHLLSLYHIITFPYLERKTLCVWGNYLMTVIFYQLYNHLFIYL